MNDDNNAKTLIARMLAAEQIIDTKLNTKKGIIEFYSVFSSVTLDELEGIDYSSFSYHELCAICGKLHDFIARLNCRKPYQNAESSNYRMWAKRINWLESALSNAMFVRDKKASEENK